MKKLFFLIPLAAICFSLQTAESSAFVKKLHTAYMTQLRTDVGKTFASTMVKNDGACLIYNDPVFDEIKKGGNTWNFKPKGPIFAKYALCISFIEKDNAKDIMKKIKAGIGKGSSSYKSPLMIFRKDKIIYTLTYGCEMKDTNIEKFLTEEMKKEIDTEKSNDFLIVRCGGAVETK
jgi:hypothetical protein